MKKLSLISLIAIVLAVYPMPVLCQSWNVELLGHIFWWESANDVAVQDNYAYVTVGESGLYILDISDPVNPSVTGNYNTSDYAYSVVVSEGFAYVAIGTALSVIDISDPYNPLEAGFCSGGIGGIYNIAISGNYAYSTIYGPHAGLMVIDISDPANPFGAGFCTYGSPGISNSDVVVLGNYAYVVGPLSYPWSPQFRVIDVSDPTNPEELGSCDAAGDGIAVQGSYAYLNSYGVSVIDISDPQNPHITASCSISTGFSHDIAIAGEFAYITAERFLFLPGGLWTVDISDPNNPFEVGHTLENGYGVHVTGQYAYVAAGQYLEIVNVADPSNPFEVGSYDGTGSADELAVSRNFAYAADNNADALIVIDIADPEIPVQMGKFQFASAPWGVEVSGDYAYAIVVNYMAPGEFWVLDISDPSNPVEAGFCATTWYPRNIDVSGDYAYVASDTSGLRIFDISDPQNPVEVGFYNTAGTSYGVVVAGNLAYIADKAAGLRIIDVTDPQAPHEVGFYDNMSAVWEVAVEGDRAYLTAGLNGLYVLDVSDPANPTLIGNYNTPQFAQDVEVCNGFAYVADSESGLHIIDTTNPTQFIEVGYYDTPYYAFGVFLANDLVYVADDLFFEVYDCSEAIHSVTVTLTPFNPPIIIPASGGSFAFNIACENNTSELQVFDLWTVIHLPEVGEVEILNVPDLSIPAATTLDRDRIQQVPDFAPAGTYTYYAYIGEHPWIVDHYDSFSFEKEGTDRGSSLGSPSDWPCTGEGFEAWVTTTEVEVPNEFVLLGNYPNPFNPTTNLSFSLPMDGKVHLAVYDISGRLVTELINGWRDAGVHEVTWDASHLSSGLYFCRILAGDYNDVKKMVLVK